MTKTYLKTGALYFGFFIGMCLFSLSCQDEKLTANQIIEQTIEVHGGLSNWENVKQLSFDKSVTLFNEDGTVALKTEQFQLFRLQPKLFVKLEWEQNHQDLTIIFDNDEVSKMINDSLVTDSDELQKAEDAVFAAHYVVNQPFGLLTSEADLILDENVFYNNKECYVIKVKYQWDGENADQWYYIIDPDTFEVVANKVVLTDHTSWVENLTFDTTTEFIFNAHRKSYRLNEAGDKTYLRAEYFYENFTVIYE